MRISRIFRCSRGAILPIIAMAAVPVIGIAAMGTEAGTWYVVKRHTQNAADSAAYAGALQLVSDASASTNVDSTGRQFAAQNGFCSASLTSYVGSTCGTPPTGTTQTVTIEPGHYASTV